MARQKQEDFAEAQIQGQEQEQIQEQEQPQEQNEKGAIGRKPQEVKVTAGTKNVRIQIADEVDCIIAGIPYQLKKDKAYQVPSDVAAILCNAKKAYRL